MPHFLTLDEAVALEDPLERLLEIRAAELRLADELERARRHRRQAIADLRSSRVAWRVIGEILGVTPQRAEVLGRAPTDPTQPERTQP